MKRIFLSLAIMFIPLIAQAQSVRITLMISPNPSPYLSDWTTRKETAIVTIVNGDTKSIEVKLGVKVSTNGTLQADTKLDKAPIFTLRPGINTFYGEDLVPASAVRFHGDIDTKVIRTGRLPSGSYQFCLLVHDAATLAPLSVEQCRPFTVRSYRGPGLLSPADRAKVPPPRITPSLSWSDLSPRYSARQQYQIVVMEVLVGQTPTVAFRANRPILDRSVTAATRMLWPSDVALDTPMTYVWSVRALDDAGNPLGDTKDGWAQPRSFSLGGDTSPSLTAEENGADTRPGDGSHPVSIAGFVRDSDQRPVPNVQIYWKGKVVGVSGDDGSFTVAIETADTSSELTFSAPGFTTISRKYDTRVDVPELGIDVIVVWPIAQPDTTNRKGR